MTGSPYGVTPGGSWPPPSATANHQISQTNRPSRAPVILSLAIAVIAIVVAVTSWFRPSDVESTSLAASSPQYSAEEVANARDALCGAVELVNRATQSAGARKSDDPVVTYIIAVNIRLGATASADYLLDQLDVNPAAEAGLANAIRELAVTYQETTLLHLADAEDSELAGIYERLDRAGIQVEQVCA